MTCRYTVLSVSFIPSIHSHAAYALIDALERAHRQVLEVVAGVKGRTDLEAVADVIFGNTERMFFPTA